MHNFFDIPVLYPARVAAHYGLGDVGSWLSKTVKKAKKVVAKTVPKPLTEVVAKVQAKIVPEPVAKVLAKVQGKIPGPVADVLPPGELAPMIAPGVPPMVYPDNSPLEEGSTDKDKATTASGVLPPGAAADTATPAAQQAAKQGATEAAAPAASGGGGVLALVGIGAALMMFKK